MRRDEPNAAPPAVTVVTRTRDRPLMLERACRSVCGQSFRDLRWVVVNDGGAPTAVDAVAETARRHGVAVAVVHNPASVGMEAASNLGIGADRGRYIAIHDDDDSWQPDFLAATTAILDADAGLAGVVVHARTVLETVRGDRILRRGAFVQNPWLKAVQLPDLAIANLFPPISLLFRRSAYEAIGPFDERFPVLGDWEFNLRLARHGEIAVLPKPLANYHVRRDAAGAYANSVIGHRHAHHRQEAAFRNAMLRDDLRSGRVGLGWMLAMGRWAQPPRRRLPWWRRAWLSLANLTRWR